MKKYLRLVFQLPYFPLIIAPFILFSPVLFTGKALFWGTPATQFIPWWKWSFDTLLSGSLPLWNPLLGMGAPLIANYQSALFYPPNWVYFVFYVFGDVSTLAWSQALVVALHLIWSGIGMAILTRKIGLGKLAQTISGLAFGLSGYLVARAWFASINTAVAWLPWVLMFTFETASGNKKVISTLKLGIVIGLQLLAGHAQTAWYTWLLACLWIVYWTWYHSKGDRIEVKVLFLGILKGWGTLVAAIFIGVAISAVQLFPTATYLLQSQRASAAEYEAAMTYSFWPWRFLGLVAPDIFGSPVNGDYWGYGNYWEDALYVGVTPLLLAISVAFRGVFKHRKKTGKDQLMVADPVIQEPHRDIGSAKRSTGSGLPVFLLVIIIISSILALGKNTPVFPWLYLHVPTFDMFQSPTRFSIWMVFSLALLAGIGVDNWRRPTRRGLYWTRLGTAGAFAVTLGAGVGDYLLKDIATDFKPTFVPAIAFAGLWGLGSGLLSLTAPDNKIEGNRYKKLWMLGVILWISLDLLVAGFGLNPGINLDFYREKPGNLEVIQYRVGEGRLFLLTESEDNIKYKQYFRFDSFDEGQDWEQFRATMLPNMNMMVEIPVVNNYDPLVPGRYAAWMDGLEAINIHYRDDLLDLMGVSVLEWATPNSDYGVRFIPRDGGTRLRWIPCVRYVEDEKTAWDLVFSGEIDLQKEVVIENGDVNSNQPCTLSKVTPIIVSDQPNEVIVQVNSETPGWIVLSDVWYLGWYGRLDGDRVPIYRANYLFRAIEIPPGFHEIAFVYRPVCFYVGAALSALTWIGLGIFILYRKQ